MWAQPFQCSLTFRVQCVFPPGPHVFREIIGGSTLLFTKAQQRFCCSVGLIFPHRSPLRIWIVTLHCDCALVTTPSVMGRVVGDVDRREAVQVPAVGFCPPNRQLRSSVLLVILSPAQDRRMVVVFSCSFLGVSCFPMVFLPLLISVLLSS